MKKILFATTNPAKVNKYGTELEKRNIEVLTIKDLRTNLHIEESGKDAIENAYLKAKAYYDLTNITTIAMDNSLFIEELPKEKQPGTYVRRVNGKELTDEEMLDYYTKLAEEYGGKLTAKWVYGMVIYNGKEAKEYSWSKSDFYLVDKPYEKRVIGYPLDSISVEPNTNKYWLELPKAQRNDNEEVLQNNVIDFIIKNI